jgi:CoA-transferase family III
MLEDFMTDELTKAIAIGGELDPLDRAQCLSNGLELGGFGSGQHLRAIREGGLSRPSRLQRDRAGLWRYVNLTGDPAGPPQRAKTYTGDYLTALTGWAATMMALWEVKKSERGQVIDLAQHEAVAQTNGNTLPLYTGEGAVYGHIGNRPPGFQRNERNIRHV